MYLDIIPAYKIKTPKCLNDQGAFVSPHATAKAKRLHSFIHRLRDQRGRLRSSCRLPALHRQQGFPGAGIEPVLQKAALAGLSLQVTGQPSFPMRGRAAFSSYERTPCSRVEFVQLQLPTTAPYDAFLVAGWRSPMGTDISVCKNLQLGIPKFSLQDDDSVVYGLLL